jgi:Ca-activated chloride channel family protein
MNVARKLLIQMLDSLKHVENVELALRVYGHQSYVPPQDCGDTKLEVPFEPDNIDKIKQKLNQVEARGTTPIAHSLYLSGNDFPDNKARNIIILITDGIEACDGDPCAVSRELQKKGVFLKPFVIGVGLDVKLKKTFECVGNYYDAANEKRFNDVLNIVISQALNNTSAQVNLLDINNRPTETNVNMTFYNARTGAVVHNYIHTMNAFGFPDTLYLDPFDTYNMVVHTIPPVRVDSIKMLVGKHITIPAYVPQGKLDIRTKDIKVKPEIVVHQDDKREIINVQKVNKPEKYLVGKYDIEILTLPRIIMEDVEIKPDHTASFDIPASGVVTFSHRAKGYGSVYVKRGDELEWVYNLDGDKYSETLYLLPGNYVVVFRSKGVYETVYTESKNFKVYSKRSQQVRIDYN